MAIWILLPNNKFLSDALNISANSKSLILFDCKSGSKGISSSSSSSSGSSLYVYVVVY